MNIKLIIIICSIMTIFGALILALIIYADKQKEQGIEFIDEHVKKLRLQKKALKDKGTLSIVLFDILSEINQNDSINSSLEDKSEIIYRVIINDEILLNLFIFIKKDESFSKEYEQKAKDLLAKSKKAKVVFVTEVFEKKLLEENQFPIIKKGNILIIHPKILDEQVRKMRSQLSKTTS